MNTAKLKAAAQGALQPHERLSALPPNDIFDISLAEGTQLDADITAVNAFHDESTPAKILELIAALEAAQKRNAELTDALKQAVSGYKSCLRTGHERIIELGGECNEPEVMIAGNPDIRQAEKILAGGEA